jgi:hypothetical protein
MSNFCERAPREQSAIRTPEFAIYISGVQDAADGTELTLTRSRRKGKTHTALKLDC